MNLSVGGQGDNSSVNKLTISTLNQANNSSASADASQTTNSSPSASTKLIAMPDREIINLDLSGNVVGFGDTVSAAILPSSTKSVDSSPIVVKNCIYPPITTSLTLPVNTSVTNTTTPSTSSPVVVNVYPEDPPTCTPVAVNRQSFGKTYSKKATTVITVPVTATVDQFKTNHPLAKSNSQAPALKLIRASQCGAPSLTTLSVKDAPANTISLANNSKGTIQVLNITPQTHSKSLVTSVSMANKASPVKLPSNIEVIKNSAGVPIKLVRGTSGGGTIHAIDGNKISKGAPFTKIVQKIHQGSPTTTTQGANIMRIMADKSIKMSTSGTVYYIYAHSGIPLALVLSVTRVQVYADVYEAIYVLNLWQCKVCLC